MASTMRILALAALGVAAAGVADEKHPGEPPHRPWKLQAGYRVLDLSKVPLVIDEPGRYAIGRDWNVDLAMPGTLLGIVADDVTIDFRGFTVTFANQGTGIGIDGDRVTIRNGALLGSTMVTSVESRGDQTTIDNMRITGDLIVNIQGSHGRIRNSWTGGRFGTVLSGASAVVEGNELNCAGGDYCLEVGSDARVLGNRIGTGPDSAVVVYGDGSVLANNIVAFGNSPAPVAVVVQGDRNVLRDNTVVVRDLDASQVLFSVDGTANVLDGNIAAPQSSARAGIGIAFSRDGNYHGDNRLGGVLEAVQANGTVQTDWGGTVAF